MSASVSNLYPDEEDSADFRFYLNEPANSVVVEVFGPLPGTDTVRSFDLGPLGRGFHEVEWDGTDADEEDLPLGRTYSFRVLTGSDGHGEWTNITPMDGSDQIVSSHYPSLAGIAVIRSMDSPFFGVVGVVNTVPHTGSDFEAVNMGVYLLNGDLTWRGGSAAAAYAAAQNDPSPPWEVDRGSSPWLLKAGRDDGMFYLGDWGYLPGSWGSPGVTNAVYRYDMTNTAVQILTPGAANHGQVMAAMTTGTGHGTFLWGLDRLADDTDHGEVYRWNTATAAPFADEPTRIIAATGWGTDPIIGHAALRTVWDFTIDDEGNFYLPNRRDAASDPRYIKFDPNGDPVWSRTGAQLASEGYPSPVSGGGNIYARTVAYNNGILYGLDELANIVALLDAEDGTLLDHFTYTDVGVRCGRGVAVDVAGNVYVSNDNTKRISVWSPPGVTSFTSTYAHAIMIGDGPLSVPETSWMFYE